MPDGSRRLFFSRPSGLGKELESKEALMSWSERMVLDGVFRVPSLLEDYKELVDTPGFDPKDRVTKGKIQAISEKAKQIANAMSKADIGTALHDITEDIDWGRDPGWIPPEFEPLVYAYAEAMERAKRDHGLVLLETELFVVNDTWQAAGSLDKLGYWHDKLRVLDSKSSGTMAYSKGKFAIQILSYAMSRRYSPRDALNKVDAFGLGIGRAPFVERVDVDQETGIIIHFASDGTKCEFLEIPIHFGHQGYKTSLEVREWNNLWNRKAQKFEEHPLISVDGLELMKQREETR